MDIVILLHVIKFDILLFTLYELEMILVYVFVISCSLFWYLYFVACCTA